MSKGFYDKVAKKFGGYGYGTGPRYKSEHPTGNPEKIFKKKLLGLSSKDKIALDIGCADGKFTLSVAPSFRKVFGIDTSRVNLDIAKSHSGDERSKNVEYFLQDASHTSFEDSFFDLAYCRRGPTYYEECCRILKTKGHYLEIGIGEMDAIELKKIFGRGQGYGKWNNSKLNDNLKELGNLGFKVVFAKNYHYFEYYPSYEELDLFLQGVPIFEDFNPEKDKAALQRYVEKFTTDKGIQLSRHRLVMVMQKVS
ncbi:MAG: Methyltransferase [Candidatus Woesebacteria bacterium GW2011_GWE1_45_18]|uniref:Methyltransferase n=5 Tax=Candidatus Woeseibacteriota TaxID=1752722 RepID=A0A0G1QTT8_9BACT|nr:MAG: Methyltransferase [Candidatus Woesebacteria bacterium GW2011_GWE1_45_18]KKU48332.1 MAG: Methyltransferase [Candidatus Woesebacteria bacterium GW2011_GWF2_46_8]